MAGHSTTQIPIFVAVYRNAELHIDTLSIIEVVKTSLSVGAVKLSGRFAPSPGMTGQTLPVIYETLQLATSGSRAPSPVLHLPTRSDAYYRVWVSGARLGKLGRMKAGRQDF